MKSFENDVQAINHLLDKYKAMKSQIAKIIVGQDEVIESVMISIFCNGHSLLIGVPGLAKTLLVHTISEALHLSFKRIQFTPDLMPSDISGTEILNENRQFVFNKGPLFANIILADEINRTPPKTQAALLEAMQEKSVTIAGENHLLPLPFFVLATQNPIEQEGTYPLPEAQLDRFMFSINVNYPSKEEEMEIVKSTTSNRSMQLDKVLDAEEILAFQQLIRKIPVADNVLDYAVNLASKTRPNTLMADPVANEYLVWGAGPRASQYLVLGAKCHAVLHGKYSPDIEDVQKIALPILRHRIVRNYKAEAEMLGVDALISKML